MPEFNITGWLDPVADYFAKQMGIPTGDLSAQTGGELIGNGLEALADFFTKGWLNKIVQFVAGAMAAGYGVWAPGISSRFRKEFVALGTHELLRLVDPKPSDYVEVSESFFKTVDGFSRGDWNAVLASVLRTPAEYQALMGVPVAPPIPAPTPPPELSIPIPTTQMPTLTLGKYTVSPEAAYVTPRNRYLVSG